MTHQAERYNRFALCREMLETPDVIRRFNPNAVEELAGLAAERPRLMLTGEGSSRIFPAKRAACEALCRGLTPNPETEGAAQAGEYALENHAVLGASNSGRTRELVRLFKALKARGHRALGGITAHSNTPLADAADAALVLGCGPEEAVAATKSVMEQAMAWQAVLTIQAGLPFPDTSEGAELVSEALNTEVPGDFAQSMADARIIFFAGRNDGTAEELTLKTNEIVRKPSDYLEGTYAAHGIEEIMHEKDVVILVDPFPEEEAKLQDCLARGAGVRILAVAHRDTLFPTLRVPARGPWKEYVLLAAGWNLLVEAGLAAGVNLDKPARARKVGNEV